MIRSIRIAAVLAAALPALALAETSAWTIDSSHTCTGFSVKHLVISDVKGEFASTAGKAQIDEKVDVAAFDRASDKACCPHSLPP